MIDRNLFRLLNTKRRVFLSSFCLLCDFVMDVGFFLGLALSLRSALNESKDLWIGVTVSGVCLLLSLILRLVSSRLNSSLGAEVRTKLRVEVYEKVLRLGGETPTLSKTGLTQLCGEGIEQLDTWFSTYLPTFFFAMATPLLTIAACLAFSAASRFELPQVWVSAAIYAFTIPLIPLSILIVSRFAKRIFAKYWDRYLRLGFSFSDALNGLEELKNFKTEKRKAAELDGEAESFRRATMKVLVMQLWSTCLMDAISYGGAGAIGAACISLSLLEPSTDSWLVSLFLILVALRFYLPLRRMGSLFHAAMNGTTAGRKLLKLLDQPEPVWGHEAAEIRSVTLKDVSYRYPDGDSPVLDKISLSLNGPGLYAVCGRSGAGKSTLAKILSGSRRPLSGAYLVAGETDAFRLARSCFFRQVSYLSSDTFFPPSTISEAFHRFDPRMTEKEIIMALDKVGLGYLKDRRIEEGGADLSGGERQRLALALMLSKPTNRLLILDEALSSVDRHSSDLILGRIKEVAESQIVILITHRLEETRDAKMIFMIEEGRIVEQGTEKELQNYGGAFARLCSNSERSGI